MFSKKELQKAIENKDVDLQLKIFEELGARYFKEARWDSEIHRLGYLRASGIYNYCINLCKIHGLAKDNDGNIKKPYADKIKEYRNILQEIEEKYLEDITKDNFTQVEINPDGTIKAKSFRIDWISYRESNKYHLSHLRHVKTLEEIRNQARSELRSYKEKYASSIWRSMNSTEELEKAEGIIKIHQNTINDIKRLIGTLFKEGEDVLDKAPTDYVIIGFGSFSRGEFTPYSDPDCGILIKKSNDETKEYFRKLSYYVALKIVNIGETVLPLLAIKELNDYSSSNQQEDNWFFDKITPFGFAFDSLKPGASKWPLGNAHVLGISENEKYELIGTPKEMKVYIGRYQENLYLGSMLSNIAMIYSNKNGTILVDQYIELVESTSKSIKQEIGYKLLIDDIEQYPPIKLGDEKIVFNAKKGIYRFVESTLEGICFYYELLVGNTWDKIGKLNHKGVIGTDAERNLKVALSIAMEIRLGTYLANNQKIEDIAAFKDLTKDIKDYIPEVFKISKEELIRYYYTVFPLYNRMLIHLVTKNVELLDIDDWLYDGSPLNKGLVNYQFRNYSEAFELLKGEERFHKKIRKIIQDSGLKIGKDISSKVSREISDDIDLVSDLPSCDFIFVGREDKIQEIKEKLKTKSLAIISGLGGVTLR